MRRALAAAACVAALGCGYTSPPAGRASPRASSTSWSRSILNRTTEPGLDAVFTEALREQLSRTGRLGGQGSEGRLEGELLAVRAGVAQLAPGTSGALTYRISATLRVRLFRDGTLLATTDVAGTEDYLPALRADVLTTEANRQAALRRLANAHRHRRHRAALDGVGARALRRARGARSAWAAGGEPGDAAARVLLVEHALAGGLVQRPGRGA